MQALILTADALRRQTTGDLVSYVVNRNINFTNVCTAQCGFCAFHRTLNSSDIYFLTLEKIIKKVEEAWNLGATEVCIQGGLNPDIPVNFHVTLCETIKKNFPLIHIHAFSPMEILYGAEKANVTPEEYLKTLKDAGLGSMPGTAAEILDDAVRKIICPRKMHTNYWISIIKAAHKLGIPTTSTMLYGHIETYAHRAKHLEILRTIQKETKGFTEFVPLSFMPLNTPIYGKEIVEHGATGIEDVAIYSISRLMLNRQINNIQVSWVKLTPKFAQFCLNAGANDFGGTLIEERISKSAGATSGQYLDPEAIRRLITDLGRIPVQRSTTYETIKVFKN